MDGFFEKYGRMIVVAVAICFVLLYLTPMRNVVGSSINGFAGNFANKVGESLGTVKMPDGSGGATNSEKVKVGDTLDIEGTKYIVLEKREDNQALVMTASSIRTIYFNLNYNYQTKLRPDGLAANTYEGSDVDDYLENEWYNNLSSTMKVAIQPTNIKQASYKWERDNRLYIKQETGYNGQVYNTISRHSFLPSVSEIGEVVDLNNEKKVKKFLNWRDDIWIRDSYQGDAYSVMGLFSEGDMTSSGVSFSNYHVRPAFVIGLSQVDYTEAGHTDYK